MALIQNNAVKRNIPAPVPAFAGHVVAVDYTLPLAAAVDDADLHEIGVLPANCEIVDAIVMTDASISTTTVKVGLLSGAYGAADNTRTLGGEIFSAAALTGFVRLSENAHRAIPRSQVDRGIGIKASADIAANAANAITVRVFYRQ